MKKCFVRLQKLGGGAPKSIIEYLKILVSLDYNIYVAAQKDEEAIYRSYSSLCKSVMIKTDLGTLFNERKMYNLYRSIKEEISIIEKEKPDLIIVQGEVNAFFYSYICKNMSIPLIIIIAGGDLNPNKYLISGWEYGKVICFSEENQDVIQQYYPKDSISVISNRINNNNQYNDIEAHYTNIGRINILLVSRIVDSKIPSIYNFLSAFTQSGLQDKATIKIAGSGEKAQEFLNILKKRFGSQLDIQILGHIDDLTELFRWAHIVVGKGRSVIEPIMLNRIGCVIGDDGLSCICTRRSIDNLYHYNFAGRNIYYSDNENSIVHVIKELLNGTYKLEEIKENARLVEELYSSQYLAPKLINIIQTFSIGDKQNNKVFILPKYIEFFILKIQHKVMKSV